MSTVRHRPLIWVATILMLILAACGRTGPDSAPSAPYAPAVVGTEGEAEPAGLADTAAPPPSAVDPCVLLNRTEAENLVQTPLEDARPAAAACTYTGPANGPTAQVEIYVGDGAKKQLDIERELGHQLTRLPDAGDEAYLWLDGAMIFVNRSGRWVSVRVVTLDDPARHREALTDLAATIADRI